jgi:hypothetical protein
MIFNTPVLPRIRYVEIHNYQPLFKATIKAHIKNDRLLIIGGNALGKTTILQSIVYCIAGELDLDIETINKSKRWGRNYFRGRIENLDGAYIRVEFSMAEDIVIIERGFRTSKILYFSLNKEIISKGSDANTLFEHYLRENAGYQSLNDFRFVLHKLCYLPEDRTNLVWESEVQIRLMMILFNDLIDESQFTQQRKQLKELDSKYRHIHVDLTNAEKELKRYKESLESESLSHIEQKDENILETRTETPSLVLQDEQKELNTLRRLGIIAQGKAPIQSDMRALRDEINGLAIKIENVQAQLAEREEAFIVNQLLFYETEEVKLAMHKLIHRQICPACGERADELAKNAQKYIQDGLCPLCGSEQSHKTDDVNISPLLDAQLSEFLQRRYELEKKFVVAQRALEKLIAEENELNFEYNQLKLKQYVEPEQEEDSLSVEPNSEDFVSSDPNERIKQLENKVKTLEKEHLDYINRFDILRTELEKKYAEFTRIASQRINRLGVLYQGYATAFLGMPCNLAVKIADVKFLHLDLYVPEFNGQVRTEPESCSEAQRFFLDIAFRMSVIDLAKELSQTKGTFICETPENALDVVYIDNVALMFRNFCEEGHSLIATANLQGGGLAGPILYNIPQNDRKNSILNLLEYARLSDVQSRNLSALKAILADQIIGFEGGIYK